MKEEVPVAMTVADWQSQGQTVWKKQSFNLANGGEDTLIFSVNYNRVTEDSPEHPAARDFPEHSTFLALSPLSAVLDSAATTTIDVSDSVPPSKTWVADISNDSPWDQGALWNSMLYIDPFHANKKFVTYESWGAAYMQVLQIRNALYGGSSYLFVKNGTPNFTKSCNQICATNNVSDGGARKPYCLSVTASDPGTAIHNSELLHSVPLAVVKDPVSHKSITGAAVVCSDIGTGGTSVNTVVIATTTSTAAAVPQTALAVGQRICAIAGAKGVIWIDGATSAQTNLPDTALVPLGQPLTVACSISFESNAFARNVVAAPAQSCDQACSALGVGNGAGYRAYRSKLIDNPATSQNNGLDPFTNLALYALQKASGGTVWKLASTTHIECSCGPGREMQGVASARVSS